MKTQPLFDHQVETIAKGRTTNRLFDMSDPGTGKTRAALEIWAERRKRGGGKMMVFAPKSILQPAWGGDIDAYLPGTIYSVAYANCREKAFKAHHDILITNHDAVKWVIKRLSKRELAEYDTLILDESTAFKHHTTQRSKAAAQLAKHFEYRELMSGTPNPNGVLELWHQALILDDGERLGNRFYSFRNAVCEPKQVGPSADMIEWRDKAGAEAAIFERLADITIRHNLEECISMPPNVTNNVVFDLPPKVRLAYDDMVRHAMALTDSGALITAIHAASLTTKLLQIASGAVYLEADADGRTPTAVLDDGRAELVMDLIEARQHCVVAFNWKHQRDQLIAAAKKRGFTYGVIDGETNSQTRTLNVDLFQQGELRVLFCHPQSAGHGLTLTKGTTTIWTSPTYNSEHYRQLFHRIYRAGQTQRTETIHIAARDTLDEKVYSALDGKLTSMQLLLDLMEAA